MGNLGGGLAWSRPAQIPDCRGPVCWRSFFSPRSYRNGRRVCVSSLQRSTDSRLPSAAGESGACMGRFRPRRHRSGTCHNRPRLPGQTLERHCDAQGASHTHPLGPICDHASPDLYRTSWSSLRHGSGQRDIGRRLGLRACRSGLFAENPLGGKASARALRGAARRLLCQCARPYPIRVVNEAGTLLNARERLDRVDVRHGPEPGLRQSSGSTEPVRGQRFCFSGTQQFDRNRPRTRLIREIAQMWRKFECNTRRSVRQMGFLEVFFRLHA